MKKKYIVLTGALALVVIVGGVVLVTQMNKPGSPGTDAQSNGQTPLMLTFSELQAHYPSKPEACLATSDDPALKLSSTDKNDIENVVIGTVIDIPAGTNVDVHVKSYDNTGATGTSVYESTYGSYNFTAKKTNGSQGNWTVSQFVACKK